MIDNDENFPEQCRTCGQRYICRYLNCLKEEPCSSYILDADDLIESIEELRG